MSETLPAPVAPWAEETALKTAFAAALLRCPNDPFKAARMVCGTDTHRALRIAVDWAYDPLVLSKQAELIEEYGEKHFMPTKSQVARDLYDIAKDEKQDTKHRLSAYDLFGKMMGYIEKPADGTVINNNNNVTLNKVMVVRDHGSDDEWENKLKSQQAKLIEHSRE